MVEESVLVEVDSRGRLSLGRLGVANGSRWLAHRTPDGSVLLAPVTLMTAREAAFRADPARARLLDGPWPALIDATDEFEQLAANVLDEPSPTKPKAAARQRRNRTRNR